MSLSSSVITLPGQRRAGVGYGGTVSSNHSEASTASKQTTRALFFITRVLFDLCEWARGMGGVLEWLRIAEQATGSAIAWMNA